MGYGDTEGQSMPVCIVLEVRWKKLKVTLNFTFFFT